jgi:hypothetical protein
LCDQCVASELFGKARLEDESMGHRPMSERPVAESKIIPPDRTGERSASNESRIGISFNTRGDGRAYATSSGTFAVIAALMLGLLIATAIAVAFATLLIWIVMAAVFLALLILATRLLRHLRVHR